MSDDVQDGARSNLQRIRTFGKLGLACCSYALGFLIHMFMGAVMPAGKTVIPGLFFGWTLIALVVHRPKRAKE